MTPFTFFLAGNTVRDPSVSPVMRRRKEHRTQRMMKATITIVLSCGALATTAGQPGLSEPVQVLPRDAIPAIDHPEFESAEDADRYLADDELMIGTTST